jgi:hypothetical protein
MTDPVPRKTEGFGAPTEFGQHVFRVEIPASRDGTVSIIEDYGLQGGEQGRPYEEIRVVLAREAWSTIAETARRDFNERLKGHKLLTGRWSAGTTRVERLLGKELCVLAWAAETANRTECKVICAKWAAFRPEERWWLFSQVVTEAGLAEDTERGWRRALFLALSDGDAPEIARKRPKRPTEAPQEELPLFPKP